MKSLFQPTSVAPVSKIGCPRAGQLFRQVCFDAWEKLLGLALVLVVCLGPAAHGATSVGVSPPSFSLPPEAPGDTSQHVTFTVTAADPDGLHDDITCILMDPAGNQGFIFPSQTSWVFSSSGNPTQLTHTVTVGITYPNTPGNFVQTIAVWNDFTSASEYVTVSGVVQGGTGLADYDYLTTVVPTFSRVTGGPVTEPANGSFHRVRFAAKYSGLFANSWNWYMDLYHATGTYRVQLTATPISARECYGDLTAAFALPGNLTWLRDANHNIIAKVSADCTESDSGTTYLHHCDTIVGVSTPPNRPWLNAVFVDEAHVFKGNFVTLSFSGGGATKYRVYYGQASLKDGIGAKQGRSPIEVGADRIVTLTGMDFRKAQFAVQAINAAGESELSPVVRAAPSIVWQPVSDTVAAGRPAHFAVRAAGVPPLRYQWRFNGKALPGATKPVLQLPHAQKSDVGAYDVTISNVVGSVTSAPARLTLEGFVRREK